MRGDVFRLTEDLDFFSRDPATVDKLLPAAVRAIREAGLDVQIVRAAPGFARLSVEGAGLRTEVDLAADARLLPVEQGRLGATLAGEELAVDKVLAVFGRAEARDFVDLFAVEPGYGFEHLCQLAQDKDPGFVPEVFIDMLARFDRLRREEFAVDDVTYQRLQERIGDWRERALALGHSAHDVQPQRRAVPDVGL